MKLNSMRKKFQERQPINEESYQICTYLRELLFSIKNQILTVGFKDDA